MWCVHSVEKKTIIISRMLSILIVLGALKSYGLGLLSYWMTNHTEYTIITPKRKGSKMGKRGKGSYIRVTTVPIEDVLPYVFTRDIRHQLRIEGHNYKSREWVEASRRGYRVMLDGEKVTIYVPMGSHRYQLYATKGVTCVKCGLKGKYFALERGKHDNPNRFHFNLYSINSRGKEVMMTKDHIQPRSKGGKNHLDNYQPLCYRCNQRKADKV